MLINPELVALAQWRLEELRKQAEKTAFVPPGAGGDPSAGGGMPPGGDPSMGGGAPPMDPAAMGGGAPPPMDPSMAGGGAPAPVPGGGGLTADSIAQIVTQTMQQQGGAAGGGAGGAAGAMGKPAKPDINTVAIDIFQVKKMLQFLFNTMGIPLPPDILDGPNRDPSTGTPMMPGAQGSTSDPSMPPQQPGGGQSPQGSGGLAGGQGMPMDPSSGAPTLQPSAPTGGMGAGEKMGSDRFLQMGRSLESDRFDPSVMSKAAALSAIIRKLPKASK